MKDKILVGVDARQLDLKNKLTGVGFYTINIINELQKSNDIKLVFFGQNKLNKHLIGDSAITCIESNNFLKKMKNFLWFKFFIFRLINKAKIDVFWGSSGFLPLFVDKKIKLITTVYDLIAFRYPKTMSILPYLSHRFIQPYDYRKSDILIAISKFTKFELRNILNLTCYEKVAYPSTKIKSIKLHKKNCRSTIIELNKFFFTIGTLEPRKNIQTLVDVYLKSNAQANKIKLVIAGHTGWKTKNLLKKINMNKNIIFFDYVNENEKKYLYKMCDLFIFPSHYEGFGIPIIESQVMGCKLVVKKTKISLEASNNICRSFDSDHDLLRILNNYDSIKFLKRTDFPDWKIAAQVYLDSFYQIHKKGKLL